MKKIININFHGRVVPIEETAHDILQQYVDSLRRYFANEEGRDEIINDIENRFAELFSERLKKGGTCITDDDVNSIIGSMGRPEDFEQEDMAQGGSSASSKGNNGNGGYTAGGANSGASSGVGPSSNTGAGAAGAGGQGAAAAAGGNRSGSWQYSGEPRRLYRSENDKFLGGVCGGLANYLKLDPAVVRIAFLLLSFGSFGFGFPVYFVLWIVLPPKSLAVNARKRLFRNPDDRVIAGVASGLAAYFRIEVWIPRLIFALPLIAGLAASIFRHIWFGFHRGPVFFTGGFGFTLFITYVVLWIVLPEALSASEKLEMRGEKVDLESIKNTVKNDLEGLKGRARDMGDEMKERVQQAGSQMREAGRQFASSTGPVIRNRTREVGSGIGHAIGVLFKAFFLFIASMIALSLIGVLVWILFSGVGIFPFRNYLLSGFWQNFLAWASLILFLGIPIIALLTWIIRRMMRVRSRNNYLGYIFGSLWVIGLISAIALAGTFMSNFRSRASMEDDIHLVQPSHGKMLIKVAERKEHYYDNDWFGLDLGNRAPFYGLSEDSVMMNTVRIGLVKSPDSGYHVHRIKFSRGNDPVFARNLAAQIQFDPSQSDSLLFLPQGFAITQEQKFRNQQVLLLVAVPVGKKIWIDRDAEAYHWFSINLNHHPNGWNVDLNDEWNETYHWEANTEYIMTANGLKKTRENRIKDRENEEEEDENKDKAAGNGDNNTGGRDHNAPGKDGGRNGKDKGKESHEGYRYKKNTDTLRPGKAADSVKPHAAKGASDALTAPSQTQSRSGLREMDEEPLCMLSALFL